MTEFREKIWSIQKKAVILHAFPQRKHTYRASGDCNRFDRIVVYTLRVLLIHNKKKEKWI